MILDEVGRCGLKAARSESELEVRVVGAAASIHVHAEAAVSTACHHTFAPTYWGPFATLL
jgi:hypothetical protein